MSELCTSDKSLIANLYGAKRMSMQEIANYFGVDLNAVVYFMRKHNISRRSKKAAQAASFERKKASFCPVNTLTKTQSKLKTSAIMLYWAEGTKSDKYTSVDFANSDPKMIQVFLLFLREICRIDENRLRIYLYCYADQDAEALKKYWSSVTHIPIEQFTKPYVRSDYKAGGRKMKHGMIHVRYADKKLLNQLKEWIREEVCDIL